MRIFIDTAELDEIQEACSWGIVDGGTTNPSLIRKAVEKRKSHGIDMAQYIEEICAAIPGPLSLEVISLSVDQMVKEATFLYERFNPINNNVVIKIPINTNAGDSDGKDYEGLKAIGILAGLGIPTNVTLVMTPEQALLAAKAGANYVSPFVGRVDDYVAGHPELAKHSEDLQGGTDVVRSIKKIFQNYDLQTEIIAASIRNLRHARESAEAGAEIATIPFKILKAMMRHDKTQEGIIRFAQDVVPEYKGLFEKNGAF
jgi:transaldolase